MKFIALLFLSFAHKATAQTGPAQCAYSDDVYTCNYHLMTPSQIPIDFASFSVPPQQIKLNVNGFLPQSGSASVFSSGFETIDVSQFDVNTPATLTLNCDQYGSVYIDREAFKYMAYIDSFTVRNCEIFYIGIDTVNAFETLDSLVIEGGKIDQMEMDAFKNLSLERQTVHKFPRSQGRLVIRNARFISGSLPFGLFIQLKNLNSIALVAANIESLASDTFRYNSKLTSIDVSDNPVTSLPSGVFQGLKMLSEVSVHGIEWTCTCDKITWLDDVINSNVTLHGSLMCSDKQGTSMLKYYYTECQSKSCEGTACPSLLAFVVLAVACVAMIISSTSLVLSIYILRRLPEMRNEMEEREQEVIDQPDASLAPNAGTGQAPALPLKKGQVTRAFERRNQAPVAPVVSPVTKMVQEKKGIAPNRTTKGSIGTGSVKPT
ncbi:hypothetical protein DPMN_161523 [Dreissena polymorpha]|uniref:Uncharacterized protein n=2 Tax=Dreissena polymorpha TaxID=45954 RepID=A0A9D4ESB9_DREPO|nr:hypothetical protein DPMN_161523 [Dreissena polymorpha]